ncbi:SDR family oxidoreductase [Luteolibacter ambystomatis]|uniref:SDR family oxidoreductase n=1 Tax=Luteolibacter ambystomatis TaxID=2824561 RepID=A0A975J3D1_9BACT|nr:SDR family oxidoreductase [Luteolibacter ambystomatis]
MMGKSALVTGAGSGIGLATARLLAHAGARVALLGRDRRELEAALGSLGGGNGHELLACDVADEGAMRGAIENISRLWGSLDIVVANAGINGTWSPVDELSVSEWNHTLTTNLGGTFLTIQGAVPLMKERGGSIIVVSSINGTRIFSNSGASAYASSKAAQVALARMMALELAKDGIRVNTVCPGAIRTAIDRSTERRDLEGLHLPVEFPHGDVPLTGGNPGTAEQVARLIWFLACDLSNHITGTEVFIDGGQSLLQG